MLGSVWSKSIYEMISKIISMCIKHKYAKRNFLAEGTFVFILPKLWSTFCKPSSDATSESGKGQSVLRNSPAKNTRMGCHFLLQKIFWRRPRDWTRVSCIAGRFFTVWTTRKALESLAGHLCKITFSMLIKT